MKNALVIRYGDPETCDAIVTGLASRSEELRLVKAECARLRAERDVHAYGAAKRHQAACEELAIKYQPEEHGALYWAVVGLWALLWTGLYAVYDMVEAIDWNA